MPRVTPILRKARKALQDSDLVKALQSEITHELSSTPFQDDQSRSPGDFVVEWDSPQSQDVVLRRNCESGEEVAVSAVLGPVTYGKEGVFPRDVLMKVCLKKPGLSSMLQFDCGVFEGGNEGSQFDIHNAYYIQSPTCVSPSDYRGPLFRDGVSLLPWPFEKYSPCGREIKMAAVSSLDPQLQDALKEYLVARGVGESLTNFLLHHLHKKEQGQYVNWLKKLESSVAKSE